MRKTTGLTDLETFLLVVTSCRGLQAAEGIEPLAAVEQGFAAGRGIRPEPRSSFDLFGDGFYLLALPSSLDFLGAVNLIGIVGFVDLDQAGAVWPILTSSSTSGSSGDFALIRLRI